MNKLSLTTCAFILSATSGFAATVDFEDESPLTPNANMENVGTSYTNGGITFTSSESMRLVQTGGPANGFVPNDNVQGSVSNPTPSFGQIFLTGDFNDDTNMTLAFGLSNAISFDIADIDGSGGNLETFVFTALLGGLATGTALTFNGIGAVDGQVINVAFSGFQFDGVSITGTTPNGTRNIGWGIDNITLAPVPLPAGALLMLTAMGGLAAMRRRKTNKAA